MISKATGTDKVETIKIIDFGLSNVVMHNELMLDCCGTAAYVAPEVIKKQGYGMKADIWSLGSIFYQIFSTQYLFKSHT